MTFGDDFLSINRSFDNFLNKYSEAGKSDLTDAARALAKISLKIHNVQERIHSNKDNVHQKDREEAETISVRFVNLGTSFMDRANTITDGEETTINNLLAIINRTDEKKSLKRKRNDDEGDTKTTKKPKTNSPERSITKERASDTYTIFSSCEQCVQAGDDPGLEKLLRENSITSSNIESLGISCSSGLQLKLALFEGNENRIRSLQFTQSDARKALQFISQLHNSPSVPCTSVFMARCRTQFRMNIEAHIDQLEDGVRKTALTISLINSMDHNSSKISSACNFYHELRKKERWAEIDILFSSG